MKEQNQTPYMILRATKGDYEPILRLMHEAYFPEEPTCYALKITQNAALDEGVKLCLSEGISMVARCKYDGSIVGACINESAHEWDPDMKEKFACTVTCPKVRQLKLFYAYLQRVPDIWNRFGVQKVFEICYLFVHKQHRKKGIGLKLLNDSRKLAADCGFGLIRCDATSIYTAKLCERLHMEKIADIPYCSYVSKDTLKPVFQPPYPHESVSVYVDSDPQENSKEK